MVKGQTSNYGAGNNDFWVVKTKSDGSAYPFGVATNATVTDVTPTFTTSNATVTNITNMSITTTNVTVTDTSATEKK
jgi:hypothetical protein